MTFVASNTAEGVDTYVYKLSNPATGTHNVVVSLSASDTCDVQAVSFTGAGGLDPSTPSVNGSAVAAATNFSATMTLASTDMLVAFAATMCGTANTAVVTGTQIREDGRGVGDPNRTSSSAYNTGTGSISITWSRAVVREASYVGVKLIEPVNATATPSVMEITASAPTPTVTTGSVATPDVATMTMSVNAPTISTPTDDWSNQSKSSSTWTNQSQS
jgi:hypothetical protein